MSKYYKNSVIITSSIFEDESFEGETIEDKVRRVVELNEPITDGAPLIYTDKKDGVQAAYDVRTDKWDIAVDAMGKVYMNKPAVLAEDIDKANKSLKGGKDEETQPVVE